MDAKISGVFVPSMFEHMRAGIKDRMPRAISRVNCYSLQYAAGGPWIAMAPPSTTVAPWYGSVTSWLAAGGEMLIAILSHAVDQSTSHD